jgi:hypothetical protein
MHIKFGEPIICSFGRKILMEEAFLKVWTKIGG